MTLADAEPPQSSSAQENDERWYLKEITCLLDGGHFLGDSTGFAGAHFVLREDSEAVRVAHDEVRDGGIEPVVVLQHSEPLLQVETQQTDSSEQFGLPEHQKDLLKDLRNCKSRT